MGTGTATTTSTCFFSIKFLEIFLTTNNLTNGVQKTSAIVDGMPQACKHFVVNEADL